MGSTLLSIGRFICGMIDSIVYVVISKMYDVFYEVANLFLYSDKIFETLGQRIGLILGIFMLFRLAISLVTYLISPDKISDKSKGGAKIITNIVLSLVLLVTVNIIFEQAYKIQNQIVQSRFIEKIFFGSKASKPNLDTAYVLYSSFITPDVKGCEDLFDPYVEMSDECANSLSAIKDNEVTQLIKNDILKYYRLNRLLSSYSALNYKTNGEYVFDYLPILSTVAGVIVVLVLISFSMDLATRVVKLLFLQIIAPIPIIANIDPEKGSEVFKKWYKECFTTYLTLFIRIIAINFAVFMITLIKSEFYNIFSGKSPLITALLVIGCLMFAKQVPKLIEDMLGIKMDGMALNPLKKVREQALFGKEVAGVATGALAGTAAGLKAAGSNILAPGAGGRFFGAGAGFASAFSKGVAGGFKGEKFGKNFSNSYSMAMQNKQSRADRLDDDVSWLEMKKSHIQQEMGMHSKNDAVKSANNHISKLQSAYKTIQSQATAMDTTNFSVSGQNGAYAGPNAEIAQFNSMSFAGIKELTKFKEQADSTKLQQRRGESDAQFIQRQKDHQDYLKYIEDTINNRTNDLAIGRTTTGDAATDRAIRDAFRTMNDEAKAFNDSIDSIDPSVGHISTINPATGRMDAKLINGSSKGAEARLSVSAVAQHAEKVQQYGAKKDAK